VCVEEAARVEEPDEPVNHDEVEDGASEVESLMAEDARFRTTEVILPVYGEKVTMGLWQRFWTALMYWWGWLKYDKRDVVDGDEIVIDRYYNPADKNITARLGYNLGQKVTVYDEVVDHIVDGNLSTTNFSQHSVSRIIFDTKAWLRSEKSEVPVDELVLCDSVSYAVVRLRMLRARMLGRSCDRPDIPRVPWA